MTPSSLVAIMLLVTGTSLSLGVASAGQLPRQDLPQTRRVVVTGHFEDRDGRQICRLVDVFPAPLRDFVNVTRVRSLRAHLAGAATTTSTRVCTR